MMQRVGIFALLLPYIVIGTAFARLDEGRDALEKGDYATALSELRPLADQGNPTAQVLLGDMYLTGQGVPQDDKQAVEWFRKAAEQGFAIAQNDLGFMYDNGRGVPHDDELALHWYRKSAEQGYAPAQNNLGRFYSRAVPQDDKRAVEWYRKAAVQGFSDAQYNLGVMYQFGRGVPRDDVLAYMLFSLAASSGNKTAASDRGSIVQELSLKQIEKVNELTKMWKPGTSLPTRSEIMGR
jgi:TPR repeat protein